MPLYTPPDNDADYFDRDLHVGQSIVKGNAVGLMYSTQRVVPITLPNNPRYFAFLGVARNNHAAGAVIRLKEL